MSFLKNIFGGAAQKKQAEPYEPPKFATGTQNSSQLPQTPPAVQAASAPAPAMSMFSGMQFAPENTTTSEPQPTISEPPASGGGFSMFEGMSFKSEVEPAQIDSGSEESQQPIDLGSSKFGFISSTPEPAPNPTLQPKSFASLAKSGSATNIAATNNTPAKPKETVARAVKRRAPKKIIGTGNVQHQEDEEVEPQKPESPKVQTSPPQPVVQIEPEPVKYGESPKQPAEQRQEATHKPAQESNLLALDDVIDFSDMTVKSRKNPAPSSPAPKPTTPTVAMKPVAKEQPKQQEKSSEEESEEESGEDSEGESSEEETQTTIASKPTSASKESAKVVKKVSPYEQLQKEMTTFFDKLSESCHAVLTERKDLFSKKRRYLEKLQQLSAELEYSEKKLQKAADEEDYERAAQLESTIEGIRKRLSENNEAIAKLDSKLQQLEKKRVQIPQDLAKQQQRFVQQLHELKEKETKSFDVFLKDKNLTVGIQKERLEAEADRIKRNKENVDIDMQQVEQRKQRLQAKIDEQTAEVRVRRDTYHSKVKELEYEIADLERRLAEKKKQLSDNTQLLKDAEKEIRKSRSKFGKELELIESEEKLALQRVETFKAQEKRFAKDKQDWENTMQRLSLEEKDRSDIIANISLNLAEQQKNIESLTAQQRELQQQQEERELFKASPRTASEIKQLDAELQKLNREVEELSGRQKALSVDIDKLKQDQSFIETQIPKLEKDKQNAAKSRNFKEAASLSREIKDLQDRQESNKSKLNMSESELEVVSDDVDDVKLRQSDLQKVFDQKQREQNAKLIDFVIKESVRLDLSMQKLRADESSYSSGSKNTSLVSMNNISKQLLEIQLENTQMELEELQRKLRIPVEEIKEKQDIVRAELLKQMQPNQAVEEAVEEEEEEEEEQEEPEEADDHIHEYQPAQQLPVPVALAPAPAPAPESTANNQTIIKEKVLLFRELQIKVQTIDDEITEAAAREEYEECERLDGVMNEHKAQLEVVASELAALGVVNPESYVVEEQTTAVASFATVPQQSEPTAEVVEEVPAEVVGESKFSFLNSSAEEETESEVVEQQLDTTAAEAEAPAMFSGLTFASAPEEVTPEETTEQAVPAATEPSSELFGGFTVNATSEGAAPAEEAVVEEVEPAEVSSKFDFISGPNDETNEEGDPEHKEEETDEAEAPPSSAFSFINSATDTETAHE